MRSYVETEMVMKEVGSLGKVLKELRTVVIWCFVESSNELDLCKANSVIDSFLC